MPGLAPADHLAIERLYARYNHAIRERDGVAWADCFTHDAVFSNRQGSTTGRDALIAYGTAFSTAVDARYWIDNLVLEATSDGAAGTCYLVIWHVGGGQPPRMSLTGVYTDRLVKQDGEWLFASRYIARDI